MTTPSGLDPYFTPIPNDPPPSPNPSKCCLGRVWTWLKTHIFLPITNFFKKVFCCLFYDEQETTPPTPPPTAPTPLTYLEAPNQLSPPIDASKDISRQLPRVSENEVPAFLLQFLKALASCAEADCWLRHPLQAPVNQADLTAYNRINKLKSHLCALTELLRQPNTIVLESHLKTLKVALVGMGWNSMQSNPLELSSFLALKSARHTSLPSTLLHSIDAIQHAYCAQVLQSDTAPASLNPANNLERVKEALKPIGASYAALKKLVAFLATQPFSQDLLLSPPAQASEEFSIFDEESFDPSTLAQSNQLTPRLFRPFFKKQLQAHLASVVSKLQTDSSVSLKEFQQLNYLFKASGFPLGKTDDPFIILCGLLQVSDEKFLRYTTELEQFSLALAPPKIDAEPPRELLQKLTQFFKENSECLNWFAPQPLPPFPAGIAQESADQLNIRRLKHHLNYQRATSLRASLKELISSSNNNSQQLFNTLKKAGIPLLPSTPLSLLIKDLATSLNVRLSSVGHLIDALVFQEIKDAVLPAPEQLKEACESQTSLPLINIGNSCYLNSVLQTMARLNAFNEMLQKPMPQDSILKLLQGHLAAIIHKMRQGAPEQVSLQDLSVLYSLLQYSGWQKARGSQQDPHEVITHLNNLFDCSASVISFTNQFRDLTEDASLLSSKSEVLTEVQLGLPIENTSKLLPEFASMESLIEFYRSEEIEFNNKPAQKTTYFTNPAPATLFIQQKRYFFNPLTGASQRISAATPLAPILTVPFYDRADLTQPPQNIRYALKVVICHSGGESLNGGHYTTTCLHAIEGSEEPVITHYNDNNPPTQLQNLQVASRNGYYLAYERLND